MTYVYRNGIEYLVKYGSNGATRPFVFTKPRKFGKLSGMKRRIEHGTNNRNERKLVRDNGHLKSSLSKRKHRHYFRLHHPNRPDSRGSRLCP